MSDKHKVTIYLSPELHRRLKIQAAVVSEPMSAIVEQAVAFYLSHPQVVENHCGHTHVVHHCPECQTPVVLREGELVAVQTASEAVLPDPVPSFVPREVLVPC
ncbi:MAG: hypothetical protein NZL92_09085 [Gloeomargarita sp. SKYG116]|nr:hypothetical protein [Gloeomargarita sp. SKYG116]MCS7226221.1 hypothetical protein [Gloeomargarita sp. SKYB31]MDW8401835.1 hypothetical protein [Gloeomargarita sp. SKYGB_i_bin116]